MWGWPLPRFYDGQPRGDGPDAAAADGRRHGHQPEILHQRLQEPAGTARRIWTRWSPSARRRHSCYSTYALFAMTGAQVRGDMDARHGLHDGLLFRVRGHDSNADYRGQNARGALQGQDDRRAEGPDEARAARPRRWSATVQEVDGPGRAGAERATSSSCARARASRWTAWCSRAASAVNEAALTGESIPVDKTRGRRGFRRDGQPVRLSAAAAPRAWARTPRFRRSSRWSATRRPPRRPSRRSRTRSPACSCRSVIAHRAGDDRRVAAARDRASASRWRAAFPCWSSAAPARWGWPRRSPSWSAADWARRTAFCSKPPRRWRKPAASRSSRWTRPAPSPRASRRSRTFSRQRA